MQEKRNILQCLLFQIISEYKTKKIFFRIPYNFELIFLVLTKTRFLSSGQSNKIYPICSKFFFSYFSSRFDALSHRSSGSSLNVANNLGTVSKTSTPLSGSLENLGGGELLRKAVNNSSSGITGLLDNLIMTLF
jgi:hypothetical protein